MMTHAAECSAASVCVVSWFMTQGHLHFACVGVRSLNVFELFPFPVYTQMTIPASQPSQLFCMPHEERRKLSQKDEEILQMQKLMAKLESALEI